MQIAVHFLLKMHSLFLDAAVKAPFLKKCQEAGLLNVLLEYILEKMNSQIKLLKNVTYILSAIFLIMFIIISKNIFEDLETTLKLEYMLGFNKKIFILI